jgi:hypothetical protein
MRLYARYRFLVACVGLINLFGRIGVLVYGMFLLGIGVEYWKVDEMADQEMRSFE